MLFVSYPLKLRKEICIQWGKAGIVLRLDKAATTRGARAKDKEGHMSGGRSRHEGECSRSSILEPVRASP